MSYTTAADGARWLVKEFMKALVFHGAGKKALEIGYEFKMGLELEYFLVRRRDDGYRTFLAGRTRSPQALRVQALRLQALRLQALRLQALPRSQEGVLAHCVLPNQDPSRGAQWPRNTNAADPVRMAD